MQEGQPFSQGQRATTSRAPTRMRGKVSQETLRQPDAARVLVIHVEAGRLEVRIPHPLGYSQVTRIAQEENGRHRAQEHAQPLDHDPLLRSRQRGERSVPGSVPLEQEHGGAGVHLVGGQRDIPVADVLVRVVLQLLELRGLRAHQDVAQRGARCPPPSCSSSSASTLMSVFTMESVQ